MRRLIFLFFLLPLPLFALELKVGDILLQPLDCWSCSLIEAQENSIYSHVGVVIRTTPSVEVAEALGKVRILSLNEFNARTEKGQRLLVKRLKNNLNISDLENKREEFLSYFKKEFENLKYDHDFLWDNLDENGFEKLYCSELISKLYLGFLGVEIPVKRMRFDVNREGWIRYFRRTPPDNEWGNSPGDLEKSELFYEVGKI
jgi:hypothetical protein